VEQAAGYEGAERDGEPKGSRFGNLTWTSRKGSPGNYEAVWKKDKKDEAMKAERNFANIVDRAFSGGASKSVKFVFSRTVRDGVEMAYRLRDLLGPQGEKIDVEMIHGLERGGVWKQPHQGKWYATTGGHAEHICLTLSMPKGGGRAQETVAIQCDMRKGQGTPGARFVSVQGKKAAFKDFAAAWVMTFGPVDRGRELVNRCLVWLRALGRRGTFSTIGFSGTKCQTI
jgi:hypothetical protein